MRNQSDRAGFTLVELLVVIAIIAMLVAILLPALSKARDRTKAIACAVQERQVAQALLMYAYDNRQWFSRVQQYRADEVLTENAESTLNPIGIRPYIPSSKLLKCPAQDTNLVSNNYTDPNRYYATYYVLAARGSAAFQTWDNESWFGWMNGYTSISVPENRGWPIPNVDFAGRDVKYDKHTINHTRNLGKIAPPTRQPMVTDCFNPVTGEWKSGAVNNHYSSKGANIAFVDGHSEWRTWSLSGGALTADSQVQLRFTAVSRAYFW